MARSGVPTNQPTKMWSFQGSRFFARSRFWTTFSLFEKKQSVSAPDSRNFFNNSGCNFVVWASLRFDNLAYDRFGWNDSRPILKLIIYLLLRSNSNGFLFLPDPWIISLAFSLGNWIGFCLSFIYCPTELGPGCLIDRTEEQKSTYV